MFCSNCGSKLVDGAKFCSECGARVARPEPEFRTFADVDFSEPEAAKTPDGAAPVTEEKPAREKVSFDWSNVVDEPHRKDFADIKSPWGTTGSIDERELFAEMSNSGGKSRTMSFIDVLKAEKEERERAAADKAIEYTEVLHFDHDLAPFDELQGVKLAPLYDDVDEPVKTPFDEPEFKVPEPEPEVVDEPRFEEPQMPLEGNGLDEPDESDLELSRETIAQFDEFVKSFEREAGISEEPVFEELEIEEPVFDEPEIEEPVFEEPEVEEPVVEEPVFEEPVYEEPRVSAPKFELPDFLKKITDFRKEEAPVVEEPAEEPVVEEPVVEEPTFEEPAEELEFDEPEFLSDEPPVIELEEEPEEEPFIEEPVLEEPAVEEPVFEEPVFEEPKYDDAVEEPVFEEPAVEEPVFEEPAVEEPVFEEPAVEEAEAEESSMEDLYLELSESDTTGKFGTRYDLNKHTYEEDDEEEEEEEEDESINEEELFKEMEETSAQRPSMTIAPPADKESEIEALRRRLAELTGVAMYEPEELEAAPAEEPEAEEPTEEPAEEPEPEPVDDLFAEPSDDIFEEPEEEKFDEFLFEPELTAEDDAFFEELVAASLTPEAEIEIPAEPEPEVEAEPEPEAPAEPELTFEPEVTPDIDALFSELMPASKAAAEAEIEIPAEPEVEVPAEPEPVVVAEPEPEAPAEPSVEDLYLQFDLEEQKPEMPKAPVIRLDGAEIVTEPPAPEVIVDIPEEMAAEEVPDLFVKVEEPEIPVFELPAEEPAAESVVEEPVIEEPLVIEEVFEEPAPEPVEEKETDALSLEELERDLFGDVLDEEVEAEETKKIDKFYTLYRKNEEFQRLLDEEYEKLKHGGGLTEEEKQAVDALPKMADIEAAAKEPAAEPAAPKVPVEQQKVYRQVEDETIYMPKEELEEQLKVDFTKAAAAAAVEEKQTPIEVPAEKPAETPKEEEKKEEKKTEVEYEDVEHGSKFLTVLAVIIALILIALLAVILILQIAPDSAAAAWIDSLIESITSNFSMIPPGNGLTLL